MYPDKSHDEIRKKLADERKIKNRKSAQASRERKKSQEEFLNEQIIKGITLSELLIELVQSKVCCEYIFI